MDEGEDLDQNYALGYMRICDICANMSYIGPFISLGRLSACYMTVNVFRVIFLAILESVTYDMYII